MKISTLARTGFCAALAGFLSAGAQAGEKPKPKPEAETFLDQEKAGPDYADQGEYSNDWGAAQVIALGNGSFRLVIYPGGFPGAGWDQTTRNAVEGKREGDRINFAASADGFKHSLAKGTLTTMAANGDEYT